MPPRPALDAALLDRLKQALAGDPAEAETVLAEIDDRVGDAAPDYAARAAKGSKKRAEALVSPLLRLGDAGRARADAMIEAILADPAHPGRSGAVQQIAFDPSRMRFAPSLRPLAADRADPEWSFAVTTLGALKDPGALDLLMDQTAGPATPFCVLQALVRLRAPEAAVVFEANLAHPQPRIRVFALWGLAGIGYAQPVGALVALLDAPDQRTPVSFAPGESRRAAQALADLFDWPFAWGDKAALDAVRDRCAARFPADWIARCVEDVAAGRITLGAPPR